MSYTNRYISGGCWWSPWKPFYTRISLFLCNNVIYTSAILFPLSLTLFYSDKTYKKLSHSELRKPRATHNNSTLSSFHLHHPPTKRMKKYSDIAKHWDTVAGRRPRWIAQAECVMKKIYKGKLSAIERWRKRKIGESFGDFMEKNGFQVFIIDFLLRFFFRSLSRTLTYTHRTQAWASSSLSQLTNFFSLTKTWESSRDSIRLLFNVNSLLWLHCLSTEFSHRHCPVCRRKKRRSRSPRN